MSEDHISSSPSSSSPPEPSQDPSPEHEEIKREIDILSDDVYRLIRESDQLSSQINQRNQERLLVLRNLKGAIPDDQYEAFEESLNKAIQEGNNPPKIELEPIQVDEKNPLEGLRKRRLLLIEEFSKVCTPSLRS